ncbi:hypothetical protein BURPS1710A_A2715 [Burkholderia pseudomallei 1710a]|uniref:Uncharacterized protein n=1 Tax=Burkholderia pseudomallei 1710a TaxID=320371 RepID=A0A0E1VRG9_BURPE|nr:hypothetical protein BURPS1710A_A2715 [Burkholderia pseudomallei 1710a]
MKGVVMFLSDLLNDTKQHATRRVYLEYPRAAACASSAPPRRRPFSHARARRRHGRQR